MSSALNQLMISGGNVMYHTPEFLAYVHSHKALLKAQSVKTPLDPGKVHTFEYNFVSLLVELGYPMENLFFFMVVNDIDCPTQMTREMKELKLPDLGLMENLKALYRQVPGRL